MFMNKQLPPRQRGITLLELIFFMVIVGLAMAGIFSAINYNVQHSADPVVKKQALAIAEAMLEEIEMMPFTYCDPNDPLAATASSTAGCTAGVGGVNDESRLPLGPETGETRYSTTTPYDNVSDYNGFSMASGAIMDITNTCLMDAPLHCLTGYAVSVTVANSTLNGINASLAITVKVTGPLSSTVQLQSYRTQYAPNDF